jgi:ElaB/YqjD/DUF883 family membrane-anchored ribosome-binding protein
MSKSLDSNNEYLSDRNDKGEPKSPERLEREVDQARARLGRTANELSHRLSPGELVDQALEMAREHGGEFGRNLGTQVKNNPLPMILTSVGIAWMMMSSGKNGRSAYMYDSDSFSADNAASDGSSIKSAIGDTAERSREKLAAAGERMHDATANVKHSAKNVRESLVHFYRDQPLLAGSLGIAIGAALGALVPPTELEDDAFGEIRDRGFDAAKSKALNKYEEVRTSARTQ